MKMLPLLPGAPSENYDSRLMFSVAQKPLHLCIIPPPFLFNDYLDLPTPRTLVLNAKEIIYYEGEHNYLLNYSLIFLCHYLRSLFNIKSQGSSSIINFGIDTDLHRPM